MSIQLVDNFQVNVASPIDSRIVASGSAARDAIQYKYEGLRVFDTSDGVPYVWRNGAWSGENASSITGNGTVDFITKYSSSNTLSNSVIAELSGPTNTSGGSLSALSSNNVLIGYNPPSSTSNPSPVAKLQVNGNIRTTTGFYGNGANITNLNASNIATGTMSVGRLNLTGSAGFMLVRNASTAYWEDPTNVSVANSDKVKINNDTGSAIRYVLFYDSSGTSTYRNVQSSNTKSITIQPSTGNVGINLGSTTPATTLDVNGTIRLRGGSPGAGKLLVSNADGLAGWSTQAEVSVPVGAIIMWGGSGGQIPTNWKLCDGTAAPINSALYVLLNATNPFGSGAKVPDLRERFVIGAGVGSGTQLHNNTNPVPPGPSGYSVGQFGGMSLVTLSAAQIPAHSHSVNAVNITESGAHTHTVLKGNGNSGGGFDIGSNDTQQAGWYGQASGGHTHQVPAHNTNNTGGGGTHENRPPWYALCYIIKIN